MRITLKECVRGGVLGAAAAAAFSGTLAAALVSSAPSVSPSLAAAHTAPAATPHPTITVTPKSGGPGTVVTVVGKGFSPQAMGQAGLQFEYGNPPSGGGGPISSSGGFKETLKVTSTDRKGKNVVEVMEQYSCSTGDGGACVATATAQFTVK